MSYPAHGGPGYCYIVKPYVGTERKDGKGRTYGAEDDVEVVLCAAFGFNATRGEPLDRA